MYWLITLCLSSISFFNLFLTDRFSRLKSLTCWEKVSLFVCFRVVFPMLIRAAVSTPVIHFLYFSSSVRCSESIIGWTLFPKRSSSRRNFTQQCSGALIRQFVILFCLILSMDFISNVSVMVLWSVHLLPLIFSSPSSSITIDFMLGSISFPATTKSIADCSSLLVVLWRVTLPTHLLFLFITSKLCSLKISSRSLPFLLFSSSRMPNFPFPSMNMTISPSFLYSSISSDRRFISSLISSLLHLDSCFP